MDARGWTRPDPGEVRSLIGQTGLSQLEVGLRLGVGGRRVRHWVALEVDHEGRRISFVEHLALLALDGALPADPRVLVIPGACWSWMDVDTAS